MCVSQDYDVGVVLCVICGCVMIIFNWEDLLVSWGCKEGHHDYLCTGVVLSERMVFKNYAELYRVILTLPEKIE